MKKDSGASAFLKFTVAQRLKSPCRPAVTILPPHAPPPLCFVRPQEEGVLAEAIDRDQSSWQDIVTQPLKALHAFLASCSSG